MDTLKLNLTLLLSAVVLAPSPGAIAQTDKKLKADLETTGYIHSPLPIDESKSVEAFGLKKKVLESVSVCDMEDLSAWTHTGVGTILLTGDRCKDGSHSLRLEAPAHPVPMLGWGLGRGTCLASTDIGGKNWEAYNRLHFYVYPDCPGARSIYLNLYLENDGKVKVPDQYGREGYHELNLRNGEWNECALEISGLSRDKITKLSFAIEVFGREQTMCDTLRFDVDDVRLEKIEGPEAVKGWVPADERIIFSTSGYRTASVKKAIVTVKENDGFLRIIDADSKATVLTVRPRTEKTEIGEFQTADFSSLKTPGTYRIKVGDVVSAPFYVDDAVWENSVWRILNFLLCERCGYPVPGKHGACHTDIHAIRNGHDFPINGGWHDAGDMSQQTLQTGEISYSLFQMAATAKKRGNEKLYARLMEEARWGLDYILNTRLGDGVRALGWGTNLWTDHEIGTDDDSGSREIDVLDGALENYILSGIEAYASMAIHDDEGMKTFLAKIAAEDFGHAEERFARLGYAELKEGSRGHAGMTSESQYHAHISWAASMLYKLTGDKKYAARAAEAIEYTLDCQETNPIGKDRLSGFFYRDKSRRVIVHYNHQSRDYAYMEAIAALCETQPENPDFTRWIESMKLYASCLKSMMKYVAPYGMAPSGVYDIHEIEDSAGFYATQIWVNGGVENDFKEQLYNGVKLDKEHYLRRFPVWFSFKGNTAVNLSTGKAAAICARVLGDKDLEAVAEDQLFWVVGMNPFGQSLIHGEGSFYPQLYNALPGEMEGEIPVGMQAYFNEDSPYWPQFNTATYKEVWGSSAARWLMLVSEF